MESSKPEKAVLSHVYVFGLAHTLWTLSLVTGAVSAQSPGARDRITDPNACDFVARSHVSEAVYEHACATALRDFDITALRRECEDLSDSADRLKLKTRLNLLDVFLDANSPRSSHFYAFSRGRFILELPCNHGAYNRSSVFFSYDESRLPASVALLRFPRASGDKEAQVWSRKVSVRHRMIVEYRKYRGLGDCGYFARYLLHSHTLQPLLLEAILKETCDGKSSFHWSGNLGKKPRGAGWVRLYKRK